jgi:hypothetical protein
MSRKVEYKYITSRNIVFNHGFESKRGKQEGKQFRHSMIRLYVHIYSRIKKKLADQAME